MNILRKRRKSKRKFNLLNKLLLTIFLLMMTTLAWFAYTKILNVDANLHINSWNIEFYLDDEKQENPLDITLDGLYPAMEDKVINLQIKNTGETGANIEYTIKNLKIFGNIYEIVDSPLTDSEFYILKSEPTVKNNISTQTFLKEEIDGQRRFPFEIQIENSTEVNPEEDGYFKVMAKWDGTNDNLDLKWGHDAAEFYGNPENKDQSAISFTLEINVVGKPRDEGI